MDKESLLVTSDICEEAGMQESADMMRNLAQGKVKAYLVTEHYSDYNDEIYYLSDHGVPEKVYFDKETAMAVAKQKTAEEVCRINPIAYGYELSEVSDLSEEELNKSLSEILGTDFSIPQEEEAWDYGPIFPNKLSDEQKLKIASLFKLEFFEVIETELKA